MRLALGFVVTWRHVAILAMACLMVLACSLTSVCAHESLGQVITFASVIAGIVGGHAGRAEMQHTKKAKKAPAAP